MLAGCNGGKALILTEKLTLMNVDLIKRANSAVKLT